MTTRRFAVLVMAFGVLVAVVLGITPLSYRSPEGIQKDVGFVESQVVSCGKAFKLDYASAPPGSSDECTPEVVGRWILIIASVGGAGLLAAGVLLAPKLRRRFSLQ